MRHESNYITFMVYLWLLQRQNLSVILRDICGFYIFMNCSEGESAVTHRWALADESMGRVAGYGTGASVTTGLTLAAIKHLLTAFTYSGHQGSSLIQKYYK